MRLGIWRILKDTPKYLAHLIQPARLRKFSETFVCSGDQIRLSRADYGFLCSDVNEVFEFCLMR
ncbi:hypothetical protein IEQ34_022158 [Dendrobium chrysotoxum]|uniref:Uncharacterized protein n=1 Tax=Dendrobium chrysotoxum TaxID=161865 RepID=A0AAV7FY53_DENCH|nr:hypothetical protein IEQ34_022158 [Dendrobium chrysotoxum]